MVKDLEEKIQKALAKNGLAGIKLTEEERKELEEEIRAEERGDLFLDGFFTNPDLRKRKWDLVFGSNSEGTDAETVDGEGRS